MTKVAFKEKVAYGLGDFGCNVVFATVSAWFVPYALSAGLTAAQAGLILFISKFVDAVCDVTLGIVIDNDQSRIKKLMRIGIAPTVVFLLAMFSVAYMPQSMHFAALLVLFNLTNSIFYNFFNVPYSPLSLMMTSDSKERYQLNCFRMFGSIFCMVVINSIYPLASNKLVMYVVCSAVMVCCFLATIKITEGRVPVQKNPVDLSYLKEIFATSSFWLSLVVFFFINFKLCVTMYQIGIGAEAVNPGAATIAFMGPSLVLLFVLPLLMKKESVKYAVLAVAILADLLVQLLMPASVIRYLVNGVFFSVLASMTYNVFAGVNEDVFLLHKKNVSGLIFAIAAIVSNLAAGFLGLCLMKSLNVDTALRSLTILAVAAVVLLWLYRFRCLPQKIRLQSKTL